MGRKIGYARVSTNMQELGLQLDALKRDGCEEQLIFTDKVSGVKKDRPGLEKCLAELKKGDSLLVWRLDRLGRSMKHLVGLIEDLKTKGVGFKSIRDGSFDTTTASGEMMFNIFSSMAQFERRLLQERTVAGLAAARARGRCGGRPAIKKEDNRVKMAKKMHADKSISVGEICETLKLSKATLYRYLGK